MASKAGRVQFQDIKVGKVFWLVRAKIEKKWRDVIANGQPVTLLEAPVRVEVTKKPFRTVIEDDLDGTGHLRYDEWTFEGRIRYDEGWSEKRYFDCSAFGIFTDVSKWVVKTTVDYFFTTQRAALRYCDRMERSPTYRIAFEHPHMWHKAKLRKRVGADWKGKKTIYGDIPTRTNAHRPWLHYAPLETLIGGVVVGPGAAKEMIMGLWEGSLGDLRNFYPHQLHSLEMETAAMMHHVATTPWANRVPPGAVVVPGEALGDPIKRAILEQDFVILDEAHNLPAKEE